MKSRLEKDLLNLFRNMDKDERITSMINMIKGTYIYPKNIDYMNNISCEKMEKNLESFLITYSGIEEVNDAIDVLNILDKFSSNTRLIPLKKHTESKEWGIRIPAFLLTLLIATSIYYNGKKDNQTKHDFINIRTGYINTLSTEDETLTEATNLVEVINEIVNENTTIEEVVEENNLSYSEETVLVKIVESLNSETEEDSYMPVSENMKKVKEKYLLELSYYESSKELSNDDKVSIILQEYNLTKEQFDILAAVVMGESKNGDYYDAYAVINTIFNRAYISHKWQNSAINAYGDESYANNLYYQAIMANQFSAYENGRYKQFLGVTDSDSYEAIINFLYGMIEAKGNIDEIMLVYMHPQASFRSNDTELDEEYAMFVDEGNKYFHEVDNEDLIAWLETMGIDYEKLNTWLNENHINSDELVDWVISNVTAVEMSLSR